jgi:hypothetical protein
MTQERQEKEDEPFMRARCFRCGALTAVCCGDLQSGIFWCHGCCPHPYDDDAERDAAVEASR